MDLLHFDSEVEWSRIVLAAYATSPAVQNASSMDQWHVTYANPFGFAGDGAWEDGVPWDRQEPIQADLAARISSHREAVSRELAALTRAGLLDRRRGALVLLDPARLRQLVEEAYAGG